MVRRATLWIRGRGRLWAAAVMVCSGLIFFLSGWRNPPAIGGSGSPWDWGIAAHFGMYWVLALLWYGFLFSMLGPRGAWGHGRALLSIPMVLAIAYGGAMELYQATVPGREPSWMDVGVNAVGAVTGVGGGYVVRRVVPRWLRTRAPVS